MTKRRVLILFGGGSAEHEISLLSARNVFMALDRTRFDPVLVGIDKQGRWRLASAQGLLAAAGNPRQVHLQASGAELTVPVRPAGGELAGLFGSDDVVFPVLH